MREHKHASESSFDVKDVRIKKKQYLTYDKMC